MVEKMANISDEKKNGLSYCCYSDGNKQNSTFTEKMGKVLQN